MIKRTIILLTTLVLLLVISCQNRKSKQEPELIPLELLRGEIALCGYTPGLFGKVNFGSACSADIQDDFNLAIALLHSFEYQESEKVFAKIIDQDATCAMAYWGVAMCNFHALWRPPTRDDLTKGSAAIKIAKSLPNKSEKEIDYINAIAGFYDDWENMDHRSRTVKFEKAMEKLYNKYATDKEAAIFYALALNASADLADKTYKNQLKAGSILENLFPDQPDHPGIAHYIIHSYDYPQLAERALDAARRYASIAPASAHAQHMPSHIFTRLGLWEESIKSNLHATSSAKCYAQQVEINGNWDEEIHGTDYLMYAYLQTGQMENAKAILDYMSTVKKIEPIGVKGAYPTAAIPARYYLETRNWEMAKNLQMASDDYPENKFPWSNGIIYFTNALGAIHTHALDMASIDINKLKACANYLSEQGNDYMANQVEIMVKAAEAWLLFASGDNVSAIAAMRLSAEMEYKTEKQSLTPGEVLPAQELLGDLLMAMGKPSEALKNYEVNLKQRPNRFNGVFGAAKAAQAMGDEARAKKYFEMLIELIKNSNGIRPEIEEARRFIKKIS